MTGHEFLDINTWIGLMREIQPENTETPDQLGMAKIFSKVFTRIMRYNTTTRQWMYFDGKRWQNDEGATFAKNRAMDFRLLLDFYARGIQNDDKRTLYYELSESYGKLYQREALLKDAQALMPCKQIDFDCKPDLLNCQNGTLDLNTFQIREHRPEDMLTKICACDYRPDALHDPYFDIWFKFLCEVQENNMDAIMYLQRISGYCLTASNEHEIVIFIYGITRSGKTTFLGTIKTVMGDYAVSLPPESLAFDPRKNGRSASPDLARLYGSRMVCVNELPQKMQLDEALLKNVTGGDPITVRMLYQNGFEMTPNFKMILNTNYLPQITDRSVFESERVRIITFNRHFEQAERNLHLKAELTTPEMMEAVLAWMVQGLVDIRENGERPPQSVKLATKIYEHQSDKILSFFDACMVKSKKHSKGIDVYEAYRAWCIEKGVAAEKKRAFYSALDDRGLWADMGTVDGKTVKGIVPCYELAE